MVLKRVLSIECSCFLLEFLQNVFVALLLLFERAENSFLYFSYKANTKANKKNTYSPWMEKVN